MTRDGWLRLLRFAIGAELGAWLFSAFVCVLMVATGRVGVALMYGGFAVLTWFFWWDLKRVLRRQERNDAP